MIAVLADDLSGAAELAGAALLHGLRAEVQTRFTADTDADLVCIDTDTRLRPPAEAAAIVAQAGREVAAARPEWVFKKCDSVLRGAVLAESRALAGAIGAQSITLLSANPSRGRVIQGGRYRVEGVPLHQTVFRDDPAHPRSTDLVADLLGGDLAGIATPDAMTPEDVVRQARAVGTHTLPAGGVDCIAAVLAARRAGSAPVVPTVAFVPADRAILAVCGSAVGWPLRQAAASGWREAVFALPHDVAAARRALRTRRRALIGIGDGPATRGRTPAELAAALGAAVAKILRDEPVDRMLLEGGATAIAVIRALGWTRLRASALAAAGVGVLRPVDDRGPELLVKPGSYPWPAGLWPA